MYNETWDLYWKSIRKKMDQDLELCKYREDISLVYRYIPGQGKILDAGCGIGSVCHYISDRTKAEIIGIDLSSIGLEIAKQDGIFVGFIRASVTKAPLRNNSFDLILSLGVIEHLENPREAIEEMERLLRDNGILFVTVPNLYYYPHRVSRFIKMKLGIWKLGREDSFSTGQLNNFLDGTNLVVIEYGNFFWGLKPINRFLKFLFKKLSIFGTMSYIVANKLKS